MSAARLPSVPLLPGLRSAPALPAGGRGAALLRPLPRGFAISRRSAALAGVVSTTAALTLYGNRTLAGDVYFLLAAGRHLDRVGWTDRDPFLTLSHGRTWNNQQWLAEWLFFQVQQAGGLTLLCVAYALLLASTLLPLGWMCRRRSLAVTAGAWAIAVAALVAVIDPRAGGFSVLLFAATLGLVAAARTRPRALLGLPPLFALWANLHGAFPAGLLFGGLVVAGAAADRWLGRATHRPAPSRLAVLLSASACLLALGLTPLGRGLLDYLVLFATQIAPDRGATEWQPAHRHPEVLVLVGAFVAFAGALWRRSPRPRRIEPILVAGVFALFALMAIRHAVWLGPLSFYLLHALGPEDHWRLPRRVSLPAAGAATALIALWETSIGPTPTEPKLIVEAADYAVRHPPPRGRILSLSGTGSYLLWRGPSMRVAVDGRLELYDRREIVASYRVHDGYGDFGYLRRWRVGGVLTRSAEGARALRRQGFRLAARRGRGHYLMRRLGSS